LLPKSTYLLGIGQKEKTKQNLGLTFKFGEFIVDNTRELIVVSFFVHRKGYSIVMNTWKRYDLLKQSIKHYSSCPRLESVHIVWSEPDPPSESLLKYLHQVLKSKSREGRYVKLRF
jgi:hypothetical protein